MLLAALMSCGPRTPPTAYEECVRWSDAACDCRAAGETETMGSSSCLLDEETRVAAWCSDFDLGYCDASSEDWNEGLCEAARAWATAENTAILACYVDAWEEGCNPSGLYEACGTLHGDFDR